MSQQKDEGLFGGFPAPKVSAISYIRESLPVEFRRIVSECLSANSEYNLAALVLKAKGSGFGALDEDEKELFSAGLIKIGEALTFCRGRKNLFLRESSITQIAEFYVDARNYFVHHHMYHSRLNMDRKIRQCISELPFIDVLVEKLQALQSHGLELLTKPIRKGQNDFPFEYKTFVDCLKAEFEKLNRILAMNTLFDEITSNAAIKASLENCIRNILSIIVDLTDIDFFNKNNTNQCIEEKKAAQKINQQFSTEFNEYMAFFRSCKVYRNSLCHLDDTLPKPYLNIESMFAFAANLLKMEERGYVGLLKKQFLHETEAESAVQVELPAESQYSAASSSSSSSAPQASSPKTDEVIRKVKVIATPSAQTAKSAAAAAAAPSASSASIFSSLSVYDSDSDEESKKDSKNQIQLSSPKMGGS